jgi:micrococcal nuclease
MPILSKKNQRLLFSLVVLLIWTVFVPKDIGQEKPKEIQSSPTQNVVEQTASSSAISASDSAIFKNNLQKVKVIRVVDGDTIEIENADGVAKKLRYIGVNTPETVDPRRSPQCFGQQASARNKELVSGKEIYLEKDVSEIDKYGRLLRYIYLDPSGISVNEQLVLEGYAAASKYPPDVKYQEKFKTAEEKARTEQKGLWGVGVCPIK